MTSDSDLDPALRLAATRMFLTEQDVLAIQSLIPPVGTPFVVDLGSGSGTTALAVLGANAKSRIVSIDIDRANRDWAEKNVLAHYPDADVAWYVGDASRVAREEFSPAAIHLVEVLLHDAGHDFDSVYGDMVNWLPFMKPGTPVWVHDFSAPPEAWGQVDESGGVRAAIYQLIAEGLLTTGEEIGLGWIGAVK